MADCYRPPNHERYSLMVHKMPVTSDMWKLRDYVAYYKRAFTLSNDDQIEFLGAKRINNISSEAAMICKVEHHPEKDLILKGVCYIFHHKHDFYAISFLAPRDEEQDLSKLKVYDNIVESLQK